MCDSWFGCSSEYQVAILYHEIFHILNDLPVAFNDDGKKIPIETEIIIVLSQEKIEKIKESCRKEALELQISNIEQYVRDCAITEYSYNYVCSNLSLNEINAYKAMINGYNEGWWDLTDDELKNSLETYQRIMTML